MNLSQVEANEFFEMEKIPENNQNYSFPMSGQRLMIPLQSVNKKEKFIFDIQRYSISIKKIKYQTRARKVIPLRRLELNGSNHLNPETDNPPDTLLNDYIGIEVPCPHIHIYYEGWDLKWALPAELFFEIDKVDLYNSMKGFFTYCNVRKLPNIDEVLEI